MIIFSSYELYKIVRISVICCSARALIKCEWLGHDSTVLLFGFFKNFELTRVHYCYFFWCGSSYIKIMVASLSTILGSFLQNLKRILASCSQLYINCLAMLLDLRGLRSIVYIVILSVLPALSTFLLFGVFDSLAIWLDSFVYGFKTCS